MGVPEVEIVPIDATHCAALICQLTAVRFIPMKSLTDGLNGLSLCPELLLDESLERKLG